MLSQFSKIQKDLMKKRIIAAALALSTTATYAISLEAAIGAYEKQPNLIEAHIEGIIEGYGLARVMEFKECSLERMKGPQLTPLVIADLRSGKHAKFNDYSVGLAVGLVLVERFPCLKGKLFSGGN